MKTRLKVGSVSSAILCAVLFTSTGAFAQGTSNTNTANSNNSSSSADQYPDIVEIDPFGGVSLFGEVNHGLGTKLVDGGVAGLRVTWNPSRWVGLELWGDYAQANVNFLTSSGVYPPGTPLAGTPLPTYNFGSRNYYFGLNPVFYLKPRGSRVQPYLTVGVN